LGATPDLQSPAIGVIHDLFYVQIHQALNVWLDALAQVLVEADLEPHYSRLRAEDALLQIQGTLVLVRSLNDTAPFERVLQRLPQELLKT